jgi:hypothetical protein
MYRLMYRKITSPFSFSYRAQNLQRFYIFGLWFYIFTLVHQSQAQYAVSMQRLQGNMVSHSINNASMAGKSVGWQFQADWKLSEDQKWNPKSRYVGMTLYGFDMGDARRQTAYLDTYGINNDGLYARGGKVIALAGVAGQMLSISPKWDFQYQWATGVSYHTAFYDSVTNPKNLAVSTRLNFTGQLRFDLQRKFGERAGLQLGLGISHCSNANYRKPNVGYNIVHLNLACKYRISPSAKQQYSYSRFQSTRGSLRQVALRGGYRMLSRKEPMYFPVVVAEWNQKLSLNKSNTSADRELHEWRLGINAFGELYPGKISDRMEVAAFARHVFKLGLFDITLDLGTYLHKPQLGKTQLFNCLGFQCHINDHWIFQQRLKAHLNNADYLEWGFIYNLTN